MSQARNNADLPNDLLAFLRTGRQLEFDANKSSIGHITLKRDTDLSLKEVTISDPLTDVRKRYVVGLVSVKKAGGRVFLACWSDEEPGEQGPRRILRLDLRRAFADGWVINSIEPIRFAVRPDVLDILFSPGGPKAWFATIRRG